MDTAMIKAHPFIKNLYVSDKGQIFVEQKDCLKSKHRPGSRYPVCLPVASHTDRYGYNYISLPVPVCKINGIKGRKKYKVHQLIAHCFVPNPNNYKYIDHLNDNPLDNRPENLEWVSLAENNKRSNTDFNTLSRYTLSQKMLAAYMIKEGWTTREISEKTGIKSNTIIDYRKGNTNRRVQRLFRKEVH